MSRRTVGPLRREYLSIAVVMAGSWIAIASAEPAAAAEWRTVTSGEGRFTVEMPGEPTVQKHNVKFKDQGFVLHTMSLASQEPNATLMCVFNDVPDDAPTATPGERLDLARNHAVQAMSGVLLSETPIKLGDHEGRELSIAIDGDRTVRTRLFLVGRRLYQVIAETPKGESASPLVERFLMSFKLDK